MTSILGAPSARYRDHLGNPLLLAGREACARFAVAVGRRAIEGRATEWDPDGRPLAGAVALERVLVELRFKEPFDDLEHKSLFASALSGELRELVSSGAHDALRALHHAFLAVHEFCWSERFLRLDPDSGGRMTEGIWKDVHEATSHRCSITRGCARTGSTLAGSRSSERSGVVSSGQMTSRDELLARLEELLRCPLTGQRLRALDASGLPAANERVRAGTLTHAGGEPVASELEAALVTDDGGLLYAVHEGIALMLPELAIPLTPAAGAHVSGVALRGYSSAVREFYEQVGWEERASGVYEDAARFEDLRPVAQDYVRRCHLRVREHLPPRGRYLLDAASGPVQYPEYLVYSEGFEARVCVDLSLQALRLARRRVPEGRGLFVLGDVTELPFRSDVFDAVVSLHTIYHVPAERQRRAMDELYRVLAPGGRGVVVYSWGPHSLFMRLARLPGRLLRAPLKRLRRAEAPPVAIDEPTLYFEPQPYAWFEPQRRRYRLGVWRSVDVAFTRSFIHGSLAGGPLLRAIFALERRFPGVAGRHGAYPLFIMEKAP